MYIIPTISVWFEEARTAYLEQLDMGYARMEEEGISARFRRYRPNTEV